MSSLLANNTGAIDIMLLSGRILFGGKAFQIFDGSIHILLSLCRAIIRDNKVQQRSVRSELDGINTLGELLPTFLLLFAGRVGTGLRERQFCHW